MGSGVYEIRNVINGNRYIGSAKNFDSRRRAHFWSLRRGKHHNRHLQFAWNKYGEEAFEFIPLIVCEVSDLICYEQRALDVLKPEYNLSPTAGNTLGVKFSAEVRARMSAAKLGNTATKGKPRDPIAIAKTAAAHRGMKRSAETREKISEKAKGRKWTDEAKAKLSASTKGKKKPFRAYLIGNTFSKGRHHTEEFKAAARQWMTGQKRPKSQEHRDKIAAALRGRKATPEARANQAAAQRGMKRSPETRARMALAQRRNREPADAATRIQPY